MSEQDEIIRDLREAGSLTYFQLVSKYRAQVVDPLLDGMVDTGVVVSEPASAGEGLRRYFLVGDEKMQPAPALGPFIPRCLLKHADVVAEGRAA